MGMRSVAITVKGGWYWRAQVYVPLSPQAASRPEVELLRRGRLSDADVASIAAVMRAACLQVQPAAPCQMACGPLSPRFHCC